jgi:pimeloyl-ACP methyl ester carboxylesterase
MAIATKENATAADLYREVRGNGPPLLLIPGATGDAGHFTRTADRLSDQYTVITYDRRGNSRSPVIGDPAQAATMAAQADDAAALIQLCGFSEAVVFGTSGGAEVALELLARQPAVLHGVVIHEPPLISLLPEDGPSPLAPIFELAERDPRAALEAFVRANSSDAAWTAVEPATRERMLGNALTLFRHEIGEYISYAPDPAVLAACTVPVALLISRDGLPFGPAVQAWLESQFKVTGETLSGHHAPYFDTPEVFAEELRPILSRLWS